MPELSQQDVVATGVNAGEPSRTAGFRLRGIQVSRMEAFFDAAFAFATTLVVVSLEVPGTFDELVNLMRGIPAFAVCFGLLWSVWFAHYKFCRRFGLEDTVTIVLNSLLVFVVLIYVFPLKFLFQLAIEAMTGFGPRNPVPLYVRCPGERLDDVFVIYGLGFALIWGILALLNLRAYQLHESLALSPRERCETRYCIARYMGNVGVGLLSCAVAITFANSERVVLAGWAYACLGVMEFFLGLHFGRERSAITKVGTSE